MAHNIYRTLFFLSAICWIFSFHKFLTGHAALVDDAVAYYGHINCYLESMSRGIYPLWDPSRDYGTVNEFYMRRIGEFNPFYWLIVIFNGINHNYVVAYRLFLGFYFLFGMMGFYLLCRRIFSDQRPAFLAVLLLMSSSLGMQPFNSYIFLILTPTIWFFYFITSFFQMPRKEFLWGTVFCLMIINITYIPFYFLTVLLTAIIVFLMIYVGTLNDIARRTKDFIRNNIIFCILCVVAVALSLAPGIIWHKHSQSGEAVAINRHIESKMDNTATVSINRVNEGGVIMQVVTERLWVNLKETRMGDFYIPLFAFLALAMGAFSLINRRMVFFAICGVFIYLISLADATCIHKFLFEHVFFFKYFRNLQFFLWLAVLPIFILFVASVFESLLVQEEDLRKNRRFYLAATFIVHAVAFVIFIFQDNDVIFSTYVVIALSLLLFIGIFSGWFNSRSKWLAILIFGAITVNSIQTYSYSNLFYPSGDQLTGYSKGILLNLPQQDVSLIPFRPNGEAPFKKSPNPYFSIKYFYILYENIDFDIFRRYTESVILLYDKLEPMNDDNLDFKRIENAFINFENKAFISFKDIARSKLSNGMVALPHAQIITDSSTQVKVVYYDANTVKLQTNLEYDKFLVRNNNYHSSWKAFVDGKEVPLIRTNVAFQGVWVPAGHHEVEMRFGPTWQYILSYFMIAFYIGSLGYLIWLFLKR